MRLTFSHRGVPSHEDDLREAIGRIAKFLESYRRLQS
jgi:hypothetical protein